jgi:hypothetical protein
MISDMEKKMMDDLFQEFHNDNINQFFENMKLMQNVLKEILMNEEKLKKQIANTEIPKMRLLNQEIQVLHHHFDEIKFQIQEYIYQLQNMIDIKKNSKYENIIQERKLARNVLHPFWNPIFDFYQFGLKK